MSNEIVIDVTPREINIALLEEKRLIELTKEKSNLKFGVGDIYVGKVRKIMAGLNAAFVDVGYEKDAFLHYLDLGAQFNSLSNYLKFCHSRKIKPHSLSRFRREADIPKDGKISNVLKSGQLILVQIAKEPISMKGPRLTSEISIAGRNLVLMPFSDKVSVSQKIESFEERSRLKSLLQSIKPKNFGVIIRTVAEGKKVAILDTELRTLVEKWESMAEKLNDAQPPKLVLSEISRTSAIIRDLLNVSFSSITVNDKSIHHEIKSYLSDIAPEKQKIVKYFGGKTPIFEHFGINKQVKSLFGKTVSFKNGSYLIIEHTEALHVIDVNSGNRSKSGDDQETNALRVNVASAEEIARQLRLRDMGGIIVIDFIDMVNADNRRTLYDKMKEFMSTDRAKHNILQLSKFGLLQITRQRVRPELNIDTFETCPTCHGTGKAAPSIMLVDEIENTLKQILAKQKFASITIMTHPYVASFIKKGIIPLALKWRFKYKCKIKIQENSSYSFLEYHFFDNYMDEIILEGLSGN